MRKPNGVVVSIALPLLFLATSTQASVGGAVQGAPGVGSAVGELCRVRVIRSASAGVFDLTREVLKSGKCVCRVTTGPRSQGGAAESALASLLLGRSCSDAPLAASSAAGSGGLAPFAAGGLIAGGAGAGAAFSSEGSDSP